MRYGFLIALTLLAGCDSYYMRQQQSDYVTYRHALPHSSLRGSTSDNCAHDFEACPAPPAPYHPDEHSIPPLHPYGSDTPSYD